LVTNYHPIWGRAKVNFKRIICVEGDDGSIDFEALYHHLKSEEIRMADLIITDKGRIIKIRCGLTTQLQGGHVSTYDRSIQSLLPWLKKSEMKPGFRSVFDEMEITADKLV